MDRRTLLALFALGMADVLTSCATPGSAETHAGATASPTPSTRRAHGHPAHGRPPVTTTTVRPPQIVSAGDPRANTVALTIDDGYSAETVAAYVAFAQRTGIALTFSPNGIYDRAWAPHTSTLRPLIEAGQVQIGNHTYRHAYLTELSDARVTAEIEQNEDWIQTTFATTSRPWFRPPYGARNLRTDRLATAAGFDQILLWNGSLGDSRLLTPTVLLAQAQKYLRAGNIVLGHANHPTVTHLFDALVELIRQRGLTPVTLDAMFGLRRPHPEPPYRVPVPAWTLTAPIQPPPTAATPTHGPSGAPPTAVTSAQAEPSRRRGG